MSEEQNSASDVPPEDSGSAAPAGDTIEGEATRVEGPPAAPPPQPAASGGPPSAIVAWFALGLAVVSGGAAFYVWNEVRGVDRGQQQIGSTFDARLADAKQEFAKVQDRLTPLQSRLERSERAHAQRQKEIEQRISAFQTEVGGEMDRVGVLQDAMRKTLGDLRSYLGSSQDTWRLAEARFLLNVANQRALLEHQSTTAAAALSAADAQLRELADPAYFPVREQIAKEIVALDAVPPADIPGVALKLATLVEQVGRLPVLGAELPVSVNSGVEDGAGATDAETDWTRLPGIAWDAIRQMVRVRRPDVPVGPMLAPEQEYFLRQNLRLQLEAARVAALRQDRENFQTSLDHAQQWLREYFDADSLVTTNMIDDLQRLAEIDVRPALPDVSRSLHLLRQIMALDRPVADVPRAAQPAVTNRAPEPVQAVETPEAPEPAARVETPEPGDTTGTAEVADTADTSEAMEAPATSGENGDSADASDTPESATPAAAEPAGTPDDADAAVTEDEPPAAESDAQ